MIGQIEKHLTDNHSQNLWREAAKGKDLHRETRGSGVLKDNQIDSSIYKQLISGEGIQNGKTPKYESNKESNQAIVSKMFHSARLLRGGLAHLKKYGDLTTSKSRKAFQALVNEHDLRPGDSRYDALVNMLRDGGSYAKFSAEIGKSIKEDKDRLDRNVKALDSQHQNLKQHLKLRLKEESDIEKKRTKVLADFYRRGVEHTKKLAEEANRLSEAVNGFSEHKNRCKQRPEIKDFEEIRHAHPPEEAPKGKGGTSTSVT